MLLVGLISTSHIYWEVDILGVTSHHDEFNEEAAKVTSRVLEILFFSLTSPGYSLRPIGREAGRGGNYLLCSISAFFLFLMSIIMVLMEK